jgi:hypothetical protein
MATIGDATGKSYAERLMRTVRKEEFTFHNDAAFYQASQHVGRFLDAFISISTSIPPWAPCP